MENENGHGASFEAFAARKIYEFELLSPDGESLIVEMRDVTPDALLDTTRDMKPPDVPLKQPVEFVKDVNGHVTSPLDPENPAYLKAFMQFRQRQMAAQIQAVWLADIPGTTDVERTDHILNLPSWAFNGLWQACLLVTSTSEDRIRRRTFRPGRVVEA